MAKRLIAILCSIILLVIPFIAQAAGIQEVNIRQVYLYTDYLRIYADLTDSDGEPIETPENAYVYASLDGDKLGTRNVQRFSDANDGMAYIFLIDVSGSLSSGQMSQLKTATKHWAENMDDADRMAVITLGNDVNIIQDFTNDEVAIENAVDGISNTDQRTQLYGGIEEAIKLAGRNDKDLPNRKAVLLLTDGVNDYAGGIGEEEILNKAKEENIPFYSLWTPGGQSRTGETFLNTLSDVTNGTLYNLSSSTITDIYSMAYAQFQKAFVIDFTYTASKANGEAHNLQLTVQSSEKEATDSTGCVLRKPTDSLATVPIDAVAAPGNAEEGRKMSFSPIMLIAIIVIVLILIALAVLVVAILSKQKKETPKIRRPLGPVYTPENSNIPIQKESAPQPPISVGGAEFTLTEVGGTTSKTGRVQDNNIIIGRGDDCGLILQDSQVSNHHCRLSIEQSQWLVEDMGSTNGTFINGLPIQNKTQVSSGDLIQLGSKEYRISF